MCLCYAQNYYVLTGNGDNHKEISRKIEDDKGNTFGYLKTTTELALSSEHNVNNLDNKVHFATTNIYIYILLYKENEN